ncbi:MAG: hypothetical protein AAGK14_08040 [Verrucomicrobiota bacterium]
MLSRSRLCLLGAGFLWLGGVGAAAQENVFGKRESDTAGLIGIIYDLKQDQKRNKTHVSAGKDYPEILFEFLERNWDESVLNRYFRSSRPLYTTQIFIPLMSANEAPKAFEVDQIMRPSAWIVHYKGQVSPPEDGTYRFICYSDDVMAVRLNGNTVCIGGRMRNLNAHWTSPEKGNAGKAGNGALIYGDWVRLNKDEPVDLDVIVGERPGGQFCAFLMYEKMGATYPSVDGRTVYPIFQLAPEPTPQLNNERLAPPFAQVDEVWKAHP